MAPINFDNKVKKTLEERKLQPSADAWSRLESQLDEQTNKSGAPRLWWLAVAASLVAIALVVFNNDTPDVPSETQQVETTTTPINVEEEKKENKVFIEEAVKNQTDAIVENNKEHKESVVNNSKEVAIEKTPMQTETSIVAKTTNKAEEIIKPVAEKSLEQQKIEAVVAQMKAIDSTDLWSVDNEVDALLAEAQRNIKLEKLYTEALNTVDSNALLEEVEEDLDQSFRSKVFEALKASYKTVKTAVAERNN